MGKVSDKILQESDDEDASKKNSLAERDVFKKLKDKEDGKGKGNKKKASKEPKVDYKNLDKLVEELKPKELRKVIMSYVSSISNLPEEPEKRKVNVAGAIASVNSEKDISFFEDFFISLGQNCLKAEKGIKVGHVFVTQVQMKTIRGKGVLSKKDIENGPVPEKKEEPIVKPSDNSSKKKEPKSKEDKNQENMSENTKQKDKTPDSIEEIVLLDDDEEETPSEKQVDKTSAAQKSAEDIVAEIVDDASRKSSEEVEASRTTSEEVKASKTCTVESESSKPTKNTTEEDSASKNATKEDNASNVSKKLDEVTVVEIEKEANESVLQKYSSNEIRLFLKNFMKLIDSNSSLTISDVSSECKLSEPETREMAAEVTEKCLQSPVTVDGKRQSFKLQNIFINSTWADKIAKFNFQ